MDSHHFFILLLTWVPLVLSLTVHEYAHAATANYLGDDTARLLGRMTLDPLAHIDPLGTFVLPLLGVPFGWAKPVPVNPIRFNQSVSTRYGLMLVTAAGPVSNLLLAGVSAAVLYSLGGSMHSMVVSSSPLLLLCVLFVQINIALAVFNLIPVPPLDGSSIADAFMPEALRSFWSTIHEHANIVLLLIILAPSLFGFSPIGALLQAILAKLP